MLDSELVERAVFQLGRYLLCDEIAVGGMAAVHLGRVLGPAGFSRTVAIKRLHPQYAKDPEFAAMFLDEARLAARIHHPNVVAILDVVARDGELFLVMEYVLGESLSRLLRASAQREPVPLPIVLAVMTGVLYGLHAAHEAKNERKEPLLLVHRDVSPQNVLVGADGVARVLDFGIAKAATRIHSTQDGQIKGKIAYMAPEQVRREDVDRRTDIYAAGVVLWEVITGTRLFKPGDAAALVHDILSGEIPPPSARRRGLPPALDAVVSRATAFAREERFETAMDMAVALEAVGVLATPREVGEWVGKQAAEGLRERARMLAEIESSSSPAPVDVGAFLPARRVPPDAPTDVLSEGEPHTSGTGTQLSTDTTSPSLPRERSRTRYAIAIAALLALGTVLIVAYKGSRVPASAESGPAPAAALSEIVPAPTQIEASGAASSAHEDAIAIDGSVAPNDASRERKSGPPAARAPARPAKPKRSCNPPYVMDPDGTRRYKAECI